MSPPPRLRTAAPARRKPARASRLAPRPAVATLEMVARAAGVSPSTVSRIINGTAAVSSERRLAVERAIARLDFRPNPAARGLASGRSMTVGVVTQAIDSPYYGEGLRGIEAHLQANGYAPLFMSGHWSARDEERALAQFAARRVDGVIFFAGRLGDKALAAFARLVPTVVTGRRLAGPGLASLKADDEEGARLATRHLAGLGHRRIAFLAGPGDNLDAREREAGYRRALAEAGIAFDAGLVATGDFHESGGLQAVNRLLDRGARFTALFCANDQMAQGACLALARRGLRVPADVSVVGFDDLPGSSYTIPPLTTVRQSVFTLGECAARALLEMIGGRAPRLALPAVELVVRESTQRLRA